MTQVRSLFAIIAATLLTGSAAGAGLVESAFWIAAVILALEACAEIVVFLARLLRRPPDPMQLAQHRQEAKKKPLIPGRRHERFADHRHYLDWINHRGRWAGNAKRRA